MSTGSQCQQAANDNQKMQHGMAEQRCQGQQAEAKQKEVEQQLRVEFEHMRQQLTMVQQSQRMPAAPGHFDMQTPVRAETFFGGPSQHVSQDAHMQPAAAKHHSHQHPQPDDAATPTTAGENPRQETAGGNPRQETGGGKSRPQAQPPLAGAQQQAQANTPAPTEKA